MKPTLKTRMMAMHPKNDYKFRDYCVEVFKHNSRTMKPKETDFISCVQRQTLEGVALVLCRWEGDSKKLELIRIAMKFHIYRNDFNEYLESNKDNLKTRRALKIWKSIEAGG
ncbi:MAG: hypothetical protein L0G96_20740 [Acinetobacter sp.]|nr:hypothetical protein [Acinetobacter sp.]